MVFAFIFDFQRFRAKCRGRSFPPAQVAAPVAKNGWATRRPSVSCPRRVQPAQSVQIVNRTPERKQPAHFLLSSQLHLSQLADDFHPTETLFDALAFFLTHRVAGMPRSALIDGAAAAPQQILRHVRVIPSSRNPVTKSEVS